MRRSTSRPFAVITLVLAAIVASSVFGSGIASAATIVVVSPQNGQGWSTAFTSPGGAVMFVVAPGAPFGQGALQLTTDATNAAKAQYLHAADVPLSAVTDLSYYTKQVSAPFAGADPSYQLLVDLNGAAVGGFTTFVYEPYQGGGGAVIPGVWQFWDVDTGLFWSSRTVSPTAIPGDPGIPASPGACPVQAGSGGPPFYSLAGLQAACPNAVAIGFGVNIGTFNPSYEVLTDGVTFNDTTYDFDRIGPPTSKDDCKSGGWANYDVPRLFNNQGDCIQFVNTGK